MDNVLIDERRIHVDFSQSVSKIKWKGKGKGVQYFPDQGEKDMKIGGNFQIKQSALGRKDERYNLLMDDEDVHGSKAISRGPQLSRDRKRFEKGERNSRSDKHSRRSRSRSRSREKDVGKRHKSKDRDHGSS